MFIDPHQLSHPQTSAILFYPSSAEREREGVRKKEIDRERHFNRQTCETYLTILHVTQSFSGIRQAAQIDGPEEWRVHSQGQYMASFYMGRTSSGYNLKINGDINI